MVKPLKNEEHQSFPRLKYHTRVGVQKVVGQKKSKDFRLLSKHANSFNSSLSLLNNRKLYAAVARYNVVSARTILKTHDFFYYYMIMAAYKFMFYNLFKSKD